MCKKSEVKVQISCSAGILLSRNKLILSGIREALLSVFLFLLKLKA